MSGNNRAESVGSSVGAMSIIADSRGNQSAKRMAVTRLTFAFCLTMAKRANGLDSIMDSVKQHGRFTDNHFGRSTGMIVGRYPVMVVAP
ncbi:hypothetical protein, partial [Caballeronia sp. LZ032]|uniref:hypothetical protein n=1 Tax=Caballeronia sp. LZ032 TaxID=3038565 RepID=UPI002856DE60